MKTNKVFANSDNFSVEEFIKFLEHEKLKGILYKKLQWQDGYVPNDYQAVGKLFSEFGRQRIANGSVSYYANKKNSTSWQVEALTFSFWVGSFALCMALNGQRKFLALSIWVVLSAVFWHIGHSWWVSLVDLYFANKIREYVEIYNKEVVLNNPRNTEYIESIKGLVSASDFDMHVTYLLNVSEEAFERYEEYLLTTRITGHIEVRKKFLEYVKALRNCKESSLSYKDFEVHVSRLREQHNEIKIKQVEMYYRYGILFHETKQFFWQLIPYKNQTVSENKHIDNLYRILSNIDYKKATLGEVLKSLNLLYLVGNDVGSDNVELVYTLKQMLSQYHPDKNKHEKAQEIFRLINENVNNPVLIILEDFERYSCDTYTSCRLDEFLTWNISKINNIREAKDSPDWRYQEKVGMAVYNHLLSKYEPGSNDDFGYSLGESYTMGGYKMVKEHMLWNKDYILYKYRELIAEYIVLKEKSFIYDKKKEDRKEEADDLNAEIQKNKKIIAEIEKSLKREKEKFTARVKDFVLIYEPMIDKYKQDINYFKDACAGNVDFKEQFWDHICDWDSDEAARCERKIHKAKVSTFIDERRIPLYQKELVRLANEKKIMLDLLLYLSKETERPIGLKDKAKYYSGKAKDELVSYVGNKLGNWCPILDYNTDCPQGLAGEYINICHEYESLSSKCKLAKHREDLIGLNAQYEKLLDKFKTEKEKPKVKPGNTKSKNTKELLMETKRMQAVHGIAGMVVYLQRGKVSDSELRECLELLSERVCCGEVPFSELRELHKARLVSIPEFRACTSRQNRVEVPDSELLSPNISQFKESTSKQNC